MLTLRRFRTLAESYGADLARWPEDVRGAAQALLETSPAARAALDDARALDRAIAAAGEAESAMLWADGEREAALARLRAGVAARIAPPPPVRPVHRLARGRPWLVWLSIRATGLATAGGVAIVAGMLLGARLGPVPEPDGALTLLLQPVPIEMLAD